MKSTEPPATPKTRAQLQEFAARVEADPSLTLAGELTRKGDQMWGNAFTEYVTIVDGDSEPYRIMESVARKQGGTFYLPPGTQVERGNLIIFRGDPHIVIDVTVRLITSVAKATTRVPGA
jgi:hypothetical protein